MLTFKDISISCAVTSKIFARPSVTTTRQSSSTLVMRWHMQSAAKHGRSWETTGQRPTAYPKARADAEKAVAIAPALAEARAALGSVLCLSDWKFAEGLAELKRAKELSPANPTANDLLARIIVYLGRFDEGERQAREAVELDPLSTVTQANLARVLFYAGKLDEAEVVARKAAELQPAGAGSHRFQVLIAAQRGDGEAALREAQLEPDPGFRRFELAVAHYVRGDRAGSRCRTRGPDRQRRPGGFCLSNRGGLRLAWRKR